MKKFMATMLCAAMVLGSLTACTKSAGLTGDTTGADNMADITAPEEQTSGEKQLAVQIGPDPETIDPALNSAIDGANMILHAFETLLTVDKDGEIAPGQAETYEISEDGLTWTFHLRDGLKWSDGTALTANDFVYSWKRVCDPELAAPYADTVLSMVEGFDEAIEGNPDALNVTAPDDRTFVVQLMNPCPYFVNLAAFAALSPVQQATVEENGDTWAITPETYISNGPFYVTEWVPGSYIVMSKNPYYWDAGAIKFDSLKFVLMEDANLCYSAYQAGEILFAKTIPAEEIPALSQGNEFHVEPIIGTYYISMNDRKEPFTDPLVRKALSLAVDREYVANTVMQGVYSPAYNFIGPGWADTDGSIFMDGANGGKPYISSDYETNLAEAKELLAKAGYPDGEGLPALAYSTNDQGYHKAVAEYLKRAWEALGITLDIEIVEWSSFTPMRRAGDYDISRNGWVGSYSDPSNMLELMYTSNGNNVGKYSSESFDAAIEKSRTSVDSEERSAALHEAEDIMMEDMSCIPLVYYNDYWLQSPKIKGSWHSDYGYWYFMYADIAE